VSKFSFFIAIPIAFVFVDSNTSVSVRIQN
jgi:hypothetical protein